MEKGFWKRAYLFLEGTHPCIGAFIAAMELSQADIIVEFTQYFVLILYYICSNRTQNKNRTYRILGENLTNKMIRTAATITGNTVNNLQQ